MTWKTQLSALAEEWCAAYSFQTPTEALRHRPLITRHGAKGVVVFPDADAGFTANELFAMVEELNASVPTMALLSDARHLESAPAAGSRILYCPDYPEVALAAIRSASWVVSLDNFVSQMCAQLGIPCLNAQNWRTALRTPTAPVPVNRITAGTPEFGICAVADSKFIGFFFGLVENLRQVTKGQTKSVPWKIFLLALDERAKELALAQYPDLPMTVYLASEVWPTDDWDRYQHKPIAERAYASKPRALLQALKSLKGAPLFFSDVDIHFTESPHLLRSQFGDHRLLFMPQWSDVFAWARFHGMFNSGLMGVLPGGEPFLEWWADMCVPFCRVEMDKGYFTDQVFLDMGMWHFSQIGVYREMDHNVAPWNRKTLGVYRPGRASGELRLKDHRVVKSFHAAGPDTDGFFELKFAWDQVVSFFSVIENSDALQPLYRNTLDQQLAHWPQLAESIALRERWRRRLRMSAKATTPDYVRSLLGSAARRTDGVLKTAENVMRALLAPFRSGSPVDNVSKEDQRILVDIQQRFAFSGASPSRKVSA